MERHRRRFMIRTFICLLILLSSRLSALSASAPSKLIIGYAAMSARVVPLWIAEEQGILTKYGIDSEQVFIRGAPVFTRPRG